MNYFFIALYISNPYINDNYDIYDMSFFLSLANVVLYYI